MLPPELEQNLPNRAIFISGPPEVFIKDDFAHVVDISGERRLERVMSVHSLVVYLERGMQAVAAWEARQGE